MIIERTSKEIIIRLPLYVNTDGVEQLLDFLAYREATSLSVAKQSDIDQLSNEVKKGWWDKNKNRLIK
jgi:hypothetical protein